MNQQLTPDVREVLEAVHYRPAVSILMPFDTRIGLVHELQHTLKIATDKVEKELMDSYPQPVCSAVIEKLKHVVKNLVIDSSQKKKKSIAIYISPVFQKVFFLDVPVQEKIVIDEAFEIRDLIFSTKQKNTFIILQLNGKQSIISFFDGHTFSPLQIETPFSLVNETPERVSNFSDVSERKEVMLHKFLHQVDDALKDVLRVYHLPVFVIGPERTEGHFNNITKHARSIAAYIPGVNESATDVQLKAYLEPHIAKWKLSQQQQLLATLDDAAGNKRLATGIKNVWQKAVDANGKLLVVEANYMYAAMHGNTPGEITEPAASVNSISIIKDAVDDVMEMVLKNGGDVAFVDEGVLSTYDHVAMVQYHE